MEAVVQGRIFPDSTPKVIENLLATDFVTRVIVSCWQDCPRLEKYEGDVVFVRSKPPENPGITNRNLQIYSSQRGIDQVNGTYAAKLRSDQIISVDSLKMMNRFYHHFKSPHKLFVCGDFALPFHPRDHVYWGQTEDVRLLFDIPLDSQPPVAGEHYDIYTRSETYIAQFYYARFEPEVKKMIERPREYVTDGAPNFKEAMDLSNKLSDKYFQVFPRIDLIWPKHGIYGYRYDSQSVWERWYDENW